MEDTYIRDNNTKMTNQQELMRFVQYIRYAIKSNIELDYVEINGIKCLRVPEMSDKGTPIVGGREMLISAPQTLDEGQIYVKDIFSPDRNCSPGGRMAF